MHNPAPDHLELCRSNGGVETLKGNFEFAPISKVVPVLAAHGYEITIPACLADRPGVAILHANRLMIQVAAKADDVCDWSQTERKNHWSLVLRVEPQSVDCNFIRVVEIGEGGIRQRDGTYHHTKSNRWLYSSDAAAMRVARYLRGLTKSEAEILMGALHERPWLRVCKPFAPEYPGEREWNIGAPQYVYEANAGPHPSWDAIFNHVGHALSDMPPELTAIGIDTGGKFLCAWFACILRDPSCRLPYLFLFGEENCGKSILWEAFALLVTSGVVKADRALNSDFNGELDGAILCVIEEKDVSHASSLPRIKDAVTGLTLAIRRMHTDQYQVTNYTHWIQTANNSGACRIPLGDTRFIAIHVKPLESEVPKPDLLERLKAEAPAIMHTMLTMQLPDPQGRLAMPVIVTDAKGDIQEEHVNPFAHKIVEFMGERTTWEGSARDLRDALGEGPATIAGLKAAVKSFELFLRQNRIIAKFPAKLKDRRFIIKLRRPK